MKPGDKKFAMWLKRLGKNRSSKTNNVQNPQTLRGRRKHIRGVIENLTPSETTSNLPTVKRIQATKTLNKELITKEFYLQNLSFDFLSILKWDFNKHI